MKIVNILQLNTEKEERKKERKKGRKEGKKKVKPNRKSLCLTLKLLAKKKKKKIFILHAGSKG